MSRALFRITRVAHSTASAAVSCLSPQSFEEKTCSTPKKENILERVDVSVQTAEYRSRLL